MLKLSNNANWVVQQFQNFEISDKRKYFFPAKKVRAFQIFRQSINDGRRCFKLRSRRSNEMTVSTKEL